MAERKPNSVKGSRKSSRTSAKNRAKDWKDTRQSYRVEAARVCPSCRQVDPSACNANRCPWFWINYDGPDYNSWDQP